MKKIIGFLLGLISVCAFSACDLSALMGGTPQSTGSVASESVGTEDGDHTHMLTFVAEKKASCGQEGNKAYYKCTCGDLFLDVLGTKETTLEEVLIEKKSHLLKHTPGITPTCTKDGKMEYWSCSNCYKNYADEECTQEIKLSDVKLTAEHNLTHYEGKPVNGIENGVVEHWVCSGCGTYFADAGKIVQIDFEQ